MWPHADRTDTPTHHFIVAALTTREYIASNQLEDGNGATLAAREPGVHHRAFDGHLDRRDQPRREHTTECGNGCAPRRRGTTPTCRERWFVSSVCEGAHAGLAAFRVLAPEPTGRVAGGVGLSPCGKKTPVQKNIVKHPKND